jgi:hypothetical protein
MPAGSDNRMAWVALTIAPVLGFLAMLAVWWLVVDSAGRGGIDFGVLAVGAVLAGVIVYGYAGTLHLPRTAAFRWVAYGALLTFALGLVSVALWIGFVNSPIFD